MIDHGNKLKLNHRRDQVWKDVRKQCGENDFVKHAVQQKSM